MKKLLILVVLLLLVIGSTVLAQDVTPEATATHQTFCGNLSAADCQLVTSAEQATRGLSSASIDLAAALNITNIPNAPFNALNFQLSGKGAYHVDASMMSSLESLRGAPETLLKNMQDVPKMIEDVVNSLQGQLNLTLTLPQELVKQASSSSQKLPQSLSVELRLLKGVAYINLAPLAEAMPNAKIPPGWYGLELARLLRSAMEASLQRMQQQGGAAGALPPGFDLSTISRFSNPETLKQFVTIERLADTDIGGESVAAFRTTVDYNALFNSTAFQDLMKQSMQSSGSTMTQANRDKAMQMMQEVFKGLTFEGTRYIDLKSNFVRRQEVHFNWDLTNVMKAAASRSSSSSSQSSNQAAPVVDFTFTVNFADFNSAPAIEAPTNAQVITAEQAMGMMAGGMMGRRQGGSGAAEATPEATPGM